MVKAELDRQLMIQVDNQLGSLADVTTLVSSQGINIVALCAYEINNLVSIMFVTEDNNAAKQLLEEKGFDVREDEVVLLTVDNQPGALQEVTARIAQAGIDLQLMYGSANKGGDTSPIVLIAQNNLEVMMLVKTELERG